MKRFSKILPFILISTQILAQQKMEFKPKVIGLNYSFKLPAKAKVYTLNDIKNKVIIVDIENDSIFFANNYNKEIIDYKLAHLESIKIRSFKYTVRDVVVVGGISTSVYMILFSRVIKLISTNDNSIDEKKNKFADDLLKQGAMVGAGSSLIALTIKNRFKLKNYTVAVKKQK